MMLNTVSEISCFSSLSSKSTGHESIISRKCNEVRDTSPQKNNVVAISDEKIINRIHSVSKLEGNYQSTSNLDKNSSASLHLPSDSTTTAEIGDLFKEISLFRLDISAMVTDEMEKFILLNKLKPTVDFERVSTLSAAGANDSFDSAKYSNKTDLYSKKSNGLLDTIPISSESITMDAMCNDSLGVVQQSPLKDRRQRKSRPKGPAKLHDARDVRSWDAAPYLRSASTKDGAKEVQLETHGPSASWLESEANLIRALIEKSPPPAIITSTSGLVNFPVVVFGSEVESSVVIKTKDDVSDKLIFLNYSV